MTDLGEKNWKNNIQIIECGLFRELTVLWIILPHTTVGGFADMCTVSSFMSSIFLLITLAYPNQIFCIPSREGNKLLGTCRVYCNNYLLCAKSKIGTHKMEQLSVWAMLFQALAAQKKYSVCSHSKILTESYEREPDSTGRLIFLSHLLRLGFSKLLPTLATGMSVVTSAPLLKVSPKWREQDPLAELVNVVLLLLLSVRWQRLFC